MLFRVVVSAGILWAIVCAHDVDAEVRELLDAGDQLLLQGRASYQEAIGKYSQALTLRPDDPRGRYRRAEIFCAMKNAAGCGDDLDALLATHPTHRQALTLRAKLRAARGDFAAAAADWATMARGWDGQPRKAAHAAEQARRLSEHGARWSEIRALMDDPHLPPAEFRDAHAQCVVVLGPLIDEFAKDSVELRLQRATCALWSRNRQVLNEDLKYILAREAQNLPALVLNAEGLRGIGAADLARKDVKRCLSLDPEYTPCQQLHRRMKQWTTIQERTQKNMQEKKWDNVLRDIDDAFSLERVPPNIDQLMQWRCNAYTELRDIKRGVKACNEYLSEEAENVDVLLKLAELHCMNDDLEAAQREVDRAAQRNEGHEGIRTMRQKIERLRQAASRKNYYKILDVPITASDADIRRAYRKLAKKHHPDHFMSKDISDAERKTIDQRFRDINEAKEVLLDSEKRQRYDAGEDVTKPPEQQNFHHGSPFSFQFGGGGFQFGGARHFTHHFQ